MAVLITALCGASVSEGLTVIYFSYKFSCFTFCFVFRLQWMQFCIKKKKEAVAQDAISCLRTLWLQKVCFGS